MNRYRVSKIDDKFLEKDLDSLKDFQGVLKSYKRRIWLQKAQWVTLISISVAAVALLLNYYQKTTPQNDTNSFEESQVIIDAKLDPQPQSHYFNHLDTIRLKPGTTDRQTKEIPNKVTTQVDGLEETTQFEFVKAKPGYSLDSALREMQRQIKINFDKPLNGTITIAMTIDDFGAITNPKIIAGLEPGLDSALLKYVEKLPKWQPATLNNVPTSSTVTLPIEISINSLNK